MSRESKGKGIMKEEEEEDIRESFVDSEEETVEGSGGEETAPKDDQENSGVSDKQAFSGREPQMDMKPLSRRDLEKLSYPVLAEKDAILKVDEKIKVLRDNQLGLIEKVQEQIASYPRIEKTEYVAETMKKVPLYTNKLVTIKKTMNNMHSRVVKLRSRVGKLQKTVGVTNPEHDLSAGAEERFEDDDLEEGLYERSLDGGKSRPRVGQSRSPGGIVVVNPDPRTEDSKHKYSSRHR
eukprot:Nk52_evm36s221 gene=Nk52_evmTU36s221